MCGHPFTEYHHIIPFEQCQCHEPADMVALCPIHHHQCTVGALSEAEQRGAKRAPFNLQRGFADGQLVHSSSTIAVEAGTNQFVGPGFKFIVDRQPLLALQVDSDGHLLVSLDVYDLDDNLLVAVSDNEWICGDPLPWDIEYSYNRVSLRTASRKINLEIDARSELVRVKGVFWRKSQQFSITPSSLKFNGVVQGVGLINLGLVAMSLVADTATGQFSIVPDPRLGHGCIVSWPDPQERLAKGIEAFERLCREADLDRNELCPCGSGKKVKHCHQAGR